MWYVGVVVGIVCVVCGIRFGCFVFVFWNLVLFVCVVEIG